MKNKNAVKLDNKFNWTIANIDKQVLTLSKQKAIKGGSGDSGGPMT